MGCTIYSVTSSYFVLTIETFVIKTLYGRTTAELICDGQSAACTYILLFDNILRYEAKLLRGKPTSKNINKFLPQAFGST